MLNQSSHWIEVLPPQVEVNSPGNGEGVKKKDKKHIVEAEQIPVDEFRVNERTYQLFVLGCQYSQVLGGRAGRVAEHS